MDRKLASIQTILDVLPHTNADTLEIVKVLGWTAVVLKGQFKKDQQVVYVETDSILPEGKPEWAFMKDRKFHVKTIKLRGQVSQGLIFPLSILPERETIDHVKFNGLYIDGQDVTDILGITKYEPYVPAELAGTIKGNFPEFLHKTDETRIQAVPAVLVRHKDKKFYVTEKVDGSSMTVYFKDGEFGVCSRNLDLKETEGNAFWKTARILDIENKLRSLGKNVALQGELVGPGVQGNKYKLDKLNMFVFNAFNIDAGLYCDYEDFDRLVEYLGLTCVPRLGTVALHKFISTDDLVEFSKGKSLLNDSVHREGLVFRPLVNEYDEDLRGRLSFKVINPDFLLKYNE